MDDLESNDPKTYWKLVNSLKNENENLKSPEMGIDSNTWYEYFQKLYSVKNNFENRLGAFDEIITNTDEIRTFTIPPSMQS